ncbi:MAG: GFA family protein [Caulobacteraceae bacterium]|nr:GFA family protein [Caulobacteraceae bacterium]
MSDKPFTGGCQCGAVRFRAERLGRASLCHCRMCQKAFGAFFGPYVDAFGLEWTRGAPKHFASSNMARRGFCGDCGTQLTFEVLEAEAGQTVNVAIGAFDDAAAIRPTIRIGLEDKLPFADDLARLPTRSAEEHEASRAYYAEVRSNQHPDHDTDSWTPHG